MSWGRLCGKIVLLAAVLSWFAEPLRSLPAFQNLFEDKIGRPAGCGVCHLAGSRRLTPYGREFLRLGRDRAALDALDLMDPDRDGLSSLAELRERSNPGDRRSTPDHTGSWTVKETGPLLPREMLRDVFGRDAGWEVRAARLSAGQARAAELSLKEKIGDGERFPVFFRIRERLPEPGARAPERPAPPEPKPDPWSSLRRRGPAPVDEPADARGDGLPLGRVLGWAGYAFFGDRHLAVYVVFLGLDGRIVGVRPLRAAGDQRLSKPAYYHQYDGKGIGGLQAVESPLGAEADNAGLIAAVRRCLKIMELVLAGKE